MMPGCSPAHALGHFSAGQGLADCDLAGRGVAGHSVHEDLIGSDAGADIDHEAGITDIQSLHVPLGSGFCRFVADGLATSPRVLEHSEWEISSLVCCPRSEGGRVSP